jgi:hypothetical protein
VTTRRSFSRAVAASVLAGAALLSAGASPPSRAADDLEPVPPMLFFPGPDPEARRQMEELADGWFGDVTKAVRARDLLVRRFGLVAVPVLVARVDAGNNVTHVWNAELALGSLRRTIGPAYLLWPAVKPLLRTYSSTSSEPWQRTFAALALGTFHGPDLVRRTVGSHEGSEEGAADTRKALLDAEEALGKGLEDAHTEIAAASALALAKAGGLEAGRKVAARIHGGALATQIEAREALLTAVGLLPVPEVDAQPLLASSLRSEETRVRAAAALAIACWAVGVVANDAAGGDAVEARAKAFESMLEPSQNVQIRMIDRDGAEATFARGMLARITGRLETWEELYALATLGSTDPKTAVAAAQALLFAPAQSPVRLKMAEHAGKTDVGKSLKEPVLAAFLIVAGSDGTPAGVRACRSYLKNKARQPTGRLDYDVRYHAAVGLVRGFVAGRIAPEARADAADALLEAARGHLVPAPPGGHAFRDVLEDVVKPVKDSLATTGTLPPSAADLLRAAFVDPDGIDGRDAIDVALVRLDAEVRSLFRLDSLPKAASGTGPNRVVTKDDQPQRFLLGWMEESPYFSRLDFRPERGRAPAPPAPAVEPGMDLDKR